MESMIGCSNSSHKLEETPAPSDKIKSAGIQLRTSARVSKKLKLDQEAALAALNSKKVEEEKKEEPTPIVEEKPRVRRVLWSPDDKSAFFEALNEHGKNFDEIEKYMANRAKRRSDAASSKNRERARHFYYRTWHKISKHVHFPDCVKKTTQELYALINFGELRKKVGHVTEKNSQKLNELIYSGCTQVRVKGKAWRIKTPVCRALRRLNTFEDEGEDLKLPSKVNILITPRSNMDSARVQNIAHNTKVRTTLSIDSSIQNIVTFLSRRWSAAHGNDALKLGPRKDAVPAQANFKCGQVMTSSSVSLLAHEKRFGEEGYEKVKALLNQLQVGKAKATLKYQREGAAAAVSDDLEINSEVVDPKSLAPPPGHISGDHSDSGDLRNRIGQLYLMYGKQGTLELEYWWEIAEKEELLELTKALSRLVSIAKLFHAKTKVECPCGHICKGNVKLSGSAQSKNQKQLKAAPKKVETPEPSNFKLPAPVTSGRPIMPSDQPSSSPASEAAMAALKMLQNCRYSQRPGRRRQNRSVVVQRVLPVLPKPAYPVIMSLNGLQVVPSSTGTMPIKNTNPLPDPACSTPPSVPLTKRLPVLLPKKELATETPTSPVFTISKPLHVGCTPTNLDSEPKHSPRDTVPTNSPTKVALPLEKSDDKHDLLESFKTELEEAPALEGHTTTLDGIMSELPGAEKSDPSSLNAVNSFKGILSSGKSVNEKSSGSGMMDVTPPTSPTRILKEGENQWLAADVNDFSLSSFLGHLESPLKPNGAAPLEDTHMSTDVESHFQSLMAESSLDYTAKFADLAAKIVGASPPPSVLP